MTSQARIFADNVTGEDRHNPELWKRYKVDFVGYVRSDFGHYPMTLHFADGSKLRRGKVID